MKKSDRKALQDLLNKDTRPRSPKTSDDLSDDLTRLFDDGTRLAGSAHLGSPHPTSAQPVAPARDFNRRPNSLERDALPAGLFPGTSKKLYDALYLRTRGAVVPVRTVRVTRSELMRWARIGSRNTFHSHMRHLTGVGLVIRHFEVGDNEGAVYEVCIPEELAEGSAQLTSAHPGSPQPGPAQKVGLGSAQKVSRGEVGQTVDFQRASEIPKTSIKTNTQDDDELAPLRELERELKAAPGDWRPVLRLVADEVRRAASNTPRVAHPARFAETHLSGVFAPKSRPERPVARKEPISTPAEEIEPPDPETAAEFERNRAELEKGK